MEKCTVPLRSSCHASLLTLGNVDDGALLKHIDFHKRIFGKLFGDRGYISKDLFEQLFIDGVHLITRLKKGLKNALMLQHDKIMTRKRSLIETVNDQLKKRLSDRAYPPSVLLELYHQSAIGFGCFLLFSTKGPPSTPLRSLYIPLSCLLLRSNSPLKRCATWACKCSTRWKSYTMPSKVRRWAIRFPPSAAAVPQCRHAAIRSSCSI